SLDVLIVGAGFGGIYMLHKLRELGLSAKIVDVASGVGGTWFWNRYPGARCDVESMFYSYSFDKELEQEWEWTERYPAQPEILSYINHVADRFNLRPHIQLETRVTSAVYDETDATWLVTTNGDNDFSARFCIMATGCLSAANTPDFDGLKNFKGRTFHTGKWPHEDVDFSGRRVGVIGTGSSGVQIIPEIGNQADHLTVFQRTASYVAEAFNRPLDAAEKADIKANYEEIRAAAKKTFGGFTIVANDQSAMAVSEKDCRNKLEEGWKAGGNSLMASFNDIADNEDSNLRAQDFVRDKIRQAVPDVETAEKLSPQHLIGCKRLCLGTNYYDTYNRDNVTLISLGEKGVERLTAKGVVADDTEFEIDDLILATGFDAMTGTLSKIPIHGRNNVTLNEAWEAGPRTYLGLMTHGFPNLFMITGPGSPSVLSNMLPTIEQHVEWIAECIGYLEEKNIKEIEPDLQAQDNWVEHGNEIASKTLRYSCSSWYLGANVPGKPRVFMPYIGGMPAYREKCAAVTAAGYEGFKLA
ncbi:MAG: flavin-containing monooxygenase, partial [Rhodospirillales bacterium]